MNKSTTPSPSYRFSARAALAAIGIRLRGLHLFRPVRDQVHIAQKVVKHTPVQKLYDAFITLLAGAHGLVELNKRLRADPGLQAAFGRQACAEQSVVQETLDACTEANVAQMHQAMDSIIGGTVGATPRLHPQFGSARCGYDRHAVRKRPPLPAKGTLPTSAIVAGGNWAAYWRRTMTKSSSIDSSTGKRN